MRFMALPERVTRGAGRTAACTVSSTGRRISEAALTTAACALALTACGSQTSTGTKTSAPSSPTASTTAASTAAPKTPGNSPAVAGTCVTSQLKVSITNTGALGGQAGGYLRFTNDGAAACQMDGWPGVVALTAAGHATTLKHAQSTMYGAWQAPAQLPVVKLQPGESAYAVVAADDQPTGNGNCPAPYVHLRVTPPGSSADVVVTAWLPGARTYLPACTSISGTPTAEISAITPLSSLPH